MTRYIRTSVIAASLALLTACGGFETRPYSPSPAASTLTASTTPVITDNRMGDPGSRFAAALKSMKENQLPEAQAAFLALSHDYPNLSGPLTNLGILYTRQHQRTQAVTAFIKAVTVNPANVVAWNWLGSLYRESGDYPHAEQAYRQALASQPDYAVAYLNLGILYEVSLRRPQEALVQYRSYQKYAGKEDLIVSAWIKQLEATPTAVIAGARGPLP